MKTANHIVTIGKEATLYCLYVVFILWFYSQLCTLWVPGISGSKNGWFITELPIVLSMVMPLWFMRNPFLYKYIVPFLPILCIYGIFDVFFYYLGRSPTLSDLENIGLLIDSFPEFVVLFFAICCVCIAAIGLIFKHGLQHYRTSKKIAFGLTRLIVLSLCSVFFSSEVFYNYQKTYMQYESWWPIRSVKYNGRLNYIFFAANAQHENERNVLNTPRPKYSITQELYPEKAKVRPDIHFIVLESFIDPRLLEGTEFDKSPLAENMSQFLLENNQFSLVLSPIYGGGTPQAEFELLTGTPAYQKVNAIEFNAMQGYPIRSFLRQLIHNGYQTMATVATDSLPFNAKPAYKSIGFQSVTFLGEVDKYRDQERLFDGILLAENIILLDKKIQASGAPVFNYVLGMYGHAPYEREKDKRPDVVHMTSEFNQKIHDISNQFYYRTNALATYIQTIQNKQRESIIYITSDHLPPLLSDGIAYKYSNKHNIAILINNGEVTDISGKSYYEVSWLLWDLLSLKKHKRDTSRESLDSLYMQVMTESMIQPR